MAATVQVLLWWIAFAGSHTVLSHPPVRSALTARFGEQPFLGLYSLVAFATFVPLVWTFFASRAVRAVPLATFLGVPGLRWLTILLMLVAVTLLVLAFVRPNPISPLMGKSAGATGVLRITRHPLFMAFALFGLAHLLVNPAAIDRVFFGGMLAYSLLGAAHQDWRKREAADADMRRYFEETSFFPFVAIVAGRNRLEPRELPLPALAAAAVLFVLVFAFHHRFFA